MYKSWTNVIAAAGAGALLMYLLDPQHGRSRRTELSRERWGGLHDVGEPAAEMPAGREGARSWRLWRRRQAESRAWSPRSRVLAVSAGTAMAFYGVGRHNLPGSLISLAGMGLALRGGTNRKLRQLVERSGGKHAIEVHKGIDIDANRERVFQMWSAYENFPQFMSLVKEVRPLDPNRSHWVVQGPAGRTIEWDCEVTERDSPRRLAWRSDPGSAVQHEGSVSFEDANGGTHVTVQLSYVPPGGALGHALATLFGRDPEHGMDADLTRMKAYIETGVPPRDAAQRRPFMAAAGMSQQQLQ